MEEVDKIILHSLHGVGCDFAGEMDSLKQMTTENVVEAAVRCIKTINPDFKMSHVFPPGMSARFRVGTSIAQTCQDLGYRGEIGYQTFLYSSEADIRKFFMFLIEKLPRKEGIKEDAVSSTILQRRIGQVLRDQMTKLWMPPYCKPKQKSKIPFKTETLLIPTYKKGQESGVQFVYDQICEQCYFVQSLMELNVQQLSNTQSMDKKSLPPQKGKTRESFQWKHKSLQEDSISLSSSFDDVINIMSGSGKDTKQSRFVHTQQLQFSQTVVKRPASRPAIPVKPQILKKPSKIPDHTHNIQQENEKQDVTDSENISSVEGVQQNMTEEEIQQEKENSLKEELSTLERKEMQYKNEIRDMQSSVEQMQIEISDLKVSNKGVEEKVEVQKKTCMLLPNAEENMEKLKKLIEKNSQRLLSLGKMWEEKRIPMIKELRKLKSKTKVSEDNTELKLEEIKLIRLRMKEANDETKRKEQVIQQLTVELESMKRDVSRQSYTKRILEIVSSIHKQQEEIQRVISEVKDVQKQINKMKGRIDRTFTAVDEVMFKDAKKDENIRQAYKHLVALHDGCSDLLRTVDETGSILRDIRQLEDQIDNESKKNAEENLFKIMKDYKEIKKENSELIKQLKKK